MLVLAALSLVVALAALALAGLLWKERLDARTRTRSGAAPLPEDVLGLRQEVAALRLESAQALRHLAIVRYDAFGDMGGHLSWSLALADDAGDGVLLTSIHGRNDARSYAKTISAWRCEVQLSPEEEQALGQLRR
ncbi:DUF4446 family protein [Nocardioides nematodiphilus]|uniref:DUF4446 family protein n=1 Tax=Nocardioides nematodiphilus TaxID=2849669 RepID=UPI001CD9DE70|nr:DUF4446 family protein [Nocardioides nematodiphilus]MCA1984338.1 DUF4446 family protein [Nocardioides nematodiphilus]